MKSRFLIAGTAMLAGCATSHLPPPMNDDFARALVSTTSRANPDTDLYGALIGTWSVVVTDHAEDGSSHRANGEWLFARTLEGRAVQDVWISPPRSARNEAHVPGPLDRYGTSIRTPLPGGREWLVTWLNPVRHVELRLTGRRVGERIVQEGELPDGTRLRWTFSDVSRNSFHWTGEVSADAGRSWRLQQEMQATRTAAGKSGSDDRVHTAMIRELEARAPHPSLGEGAAAFDWLEGSWDLDCDIISRDGSRTRSIADWHFGWIVKGHMVQDALYFHPPGQPEKRDGGTSVRLYDTKRKEWTVIWFSPGGNFFVALKGGKVGERIVLHGKEGEIALLRWTFDEIRPDSFHWLGERSEDGGKTWWAEQEMFARRRP
jgi:hypothetical protein